jgi:N-acetylmuramoyl-L-alanine amidase
MSKKLTFLIIHCSATPGGREVTSDTIRQWHMGPLFNGKTIIFEGKTYPSVEALPDKFIGGVSIKKIRGRGWSRVGYADMVHLDGSIENLVPYDENDVVDPWEITNGASGINSISRHIVYVGGTDSKGYPEDTRTLKQIMALDEYVNNVVAKHPHILIAGHSDFAPKACPSFAVKEWLQFIQVPERNIYIKK